MGTRSLTIVNSGLGSGCKQLVTIYRQHDGYPTGHGFTVASFLRDKKIVNGIPFPVPAGIANGPGCLAAQLIVFLKGTNIGPGDIYIHKPFDGNLAKLKESDIEFVYTIYADDYDISPGIRFSCFDVREQIMLYDGTPEGFMSYLNTIDE